MILSKKNKTALLVFYTVLLAFLSFIPGSSNSSLMPGTDKIIHFLFYLVLSLICIYSEIFKKFNNEKLIIIALCTLYGLFIECIQAVLPWRSFELLDIFADFAGVFTGSKLISKIYLKNNN